MTAGSACQREERGRESSAHPVPHGIDGREGRVMREEMEREMGWACSGFGLKVEFGSVQSNSLFWLLFERHLEFKNSSNQIEFKFENTSDLNKQNKFK